MKAWCKKNKKYLIAAVLVLLIIAAFSAGKSSFYLNDTDNFNDGSGDKTELAAAEGEIRQHFILRKSSVSFAVLMINRGDEDITVQASLYDAQTDELLCSDSETLPVNDGIENAVAFQMQTDVPEGSGEVYLVLTSGDPEQTVFCVQEGDYTEQRLTVGGAETDLRLRMSVLYQGRYYYGLAFLAFLLAISIVLIFLLPEKWRRPERLFLILAVIAGVNFAVILPAAQECDGPMHLYKSMDTSYGNFFGSFVNLTHEKGYVYVPDNMADMDMDLLNIGAAEGVAYTDHLKDMTYSDGKTLMEYDGGVASIVYWPQGIGIFLGRTLGLSVYACILLGHLFNLAAYIALVYFAIRLMPCRKMLFAAIALLPISLFQAASLSQDAMLNGMSLLFIALCFYFAFGDIPRITWKHMIWLGVLLLGMFLGKYVYICLGLLVFMIPMKKFGDRKSCLKAFLPPLLLLIVLGGWHLSQNIAAISALQDTGTVGAVTQTQTQYLLSHPSEIVMVLLRTVAEQTNSYLMGLNTLGNLSISLKLTMTLGLAVVAVIGVLDVNEVSDRISLRNRCLILISFGLTFCMVLMALYIGDSNANSYGATVVNGVQGRYFIMLLPLPFLALGSTKIRHEIRNFNTKCASLMGCMLLYAVFILIQSYY